MKMVSVFLVASIAFAYPDSTLAQRQADSLHQKKPVYFFSIRSGALIGCADCANRNQITFTGATVHGIRFRDRLGVGIGVGYNSYSTWQVMPLFVHSSLDLGKKNKVFLEMAYGYSRGWQAAGDQEEYGLKKSKGGRMVQPGLGYKISYHDVRIYLMAGCSFQRVEQNFEYPNQGWINGKSVPMEPNKKHAVSEFSRLFIQLGVGWQ